MKQKPITLPWMNMLRERLNDTRLKGGPDVGKWIDDASVMAFLKPILEWGQSEEIRITKSFHKKL